ncbi:MAG: methyl-accepting chemotaxis protein [Chloroflexota bacterium]
MKRLSIGQQLAVVFGTNVVLLLILGVYSEFELARYAGANSARLVVVIVVFMIVFSVVFAVSFTMRMTRPIGQVVQAVRSMAEGDLNQHIETDEANEMGALANSINDMCQYLSGMAKIAGTIAAGDLTDEVDVKSDRDTLGRSFGNMTTSLRDLISNVSGNAETLAVAGEGLAQAAQEAGRATDAISRAMSQMSLGASEQTASIGAIAQGTQESLERAQEATNIANQMSSAIQQVAINAQRVAEASDRASRAARSGGQTVGRSVERMEAIRLTVTNSTAKIRELNATSSQIGDIVSIIQDIAEQTNLLALNAAIEAARAGAQGKGFAVVAEEVRKLAERTARSTKEIGGLIEAVQGQTLGAVRAMEEGAREVENNSALSQEVRKALSEILEAVEDTNEQVQNISAAAEEMSASSQEVVQAMSSISQITDRNATASEVLSATAAQNAEATLQVTESTERVSDQVGQIVSAIEGLTEMTANLKDALQRFSTSSAKPNGDLAGYLRRIKASKANFPTLTRIA